MAYSSKEVKHIKKFNGTDFSFWFKNEMMLKKSKLLCFTKENEVCSQLHIQEGAVINQAAINQW